MFSDPAPPTTGGAVRRSPTTPTLHLSPGLGLERHMHLRDTGSQPASPRPPHGVRRQWGCVWAASSTAAPTAFQGSDHPVLASAPLPRSPRVPRGPDLSYSPLFLPQGNAAGLAAGKNARLPLISPSEGIHPGF